ncbi:MAG: peptide chain release factor N(5)-glutamine methyltransferase [Candidatus Gracilibacteria bacterium]|nr:peptide chain release factor N(5)-glutamine methyltransferase [Candidatus Gracilibacteria bacterium]
MKINYPDNEEFFALPFYVDSRVLVPRNDTETMIYQVLKEINSANFTLIDVGTGSSCIPVSILKNTKFEIVEAFALDISPDALEVAKINTRKHDLQEKLNLQKSDLLEFFLNQTQKINTKNLIITANLPYIKNGDFENMDKEVLENEPHIALFGGKDTGFELYEKLISQIFELKNIYSLEKITLFIEIGFDQREYSRKYLESLGLEIEYFKDLGGIDRIVKICF